MICPFCKKEGSIVIDTRLKPKLNYIIRRRECKHCNSRYTTKEYIIAKNDEIYNKQLTNMKNEIHEILERANEIETLIEKLLMGDI